MFSLYDPLNSFLANKYGPGAVLGAKLCLILHIPFYNYNHDINKRIPASYFLTLNALISMVFDYINCSILTALSTITLINFQESNLRPRIVSLLRSELIMGR